MALTGLLFSILITRRLTPEELGIWRYIGTLISYFTIPVLPFCFWSTRFTAQNKYILKTLLIVIMPLAFLMMLIFIIMIEIFSTPINYTLTVFLVAALEIPLIYLYMACESVINAWRPHLSYYAQMLQEIVKLPVGLILVLSLRLSLVGAILATISGFMIRSFYLILSLRNIAWGSVDMKILKKFFSLVWLPLYMSIPSYLASLDAIIVTLLSRSTEPLGYVTALFLVGSMISMSGNLAAGLYPKMLQKSSGKDVELILSLVMMFIIPTSIGAFLLREQILNILRPEYVIVAPILPIVILHSIVFVINSIVDSILIGEERVDYKDEVKFVEIVKSRLFVVPTLNHIYVIAYLPSLVAILYILRPQNILDTAMIWVTINFLVLFAITAYKYQIASSRLKFVFPKSSLIKYFLSSLLMAIIVYLICPHSLPKEVYKALQLLIPSIVVGALTYFGALSVIDKEFRTLLRTLLKFMK